MKKLSFRWPVFAIIASVSIALVWKMTPRFMDIFPESTQKAAAKLVAAVTGDEFKDVAAAETNEECVVVYTNKTVMAETKKNREPKRVKPVKKIAAAEKFSYPGELGIVRVSPRKATWAVTRMITPLEDMNGNSIGNVRGGGFFIVKEFVKEGSTVYLVGNFTPKKLENDVKIDSEYLIPFSGDVNSLSVKQREDLKRYYEIAAEAEKRKLELIKESASKSPYLEDTIAAVKKLRAMQKETAARKNMSDDANRKATYEITLLRNKVTELNEKHKQWKKDHEAELADWENDPKYLELKKSQQKYADSISGLDF